MRKKNKPKCGSVQELLLNEKEINMGIEIEEENDTWQANIRINIS